MPLPDTPPRGFRMPPTSTGPATGPDRPTAAVATRRRLRGRRSDDRPALPRRTRQANLVPQLRDESGNHAELRRRRGPAAAETTPRPALRVPTGTRQGRDDDDTFDN
jgi:hypothetical protein